MIKVFLIFGLVSYASAAASIKTPCPVVKQVENFNISGLVGVWYEVARYANHIEEQGDCVIDKYEKQDDKLSFYITEVYKNKLIEFKGYIDYSNTSSYVLKYHSPCYKATEGSDTLPISLVAVDYQNYLILYVCKHNKDGKGQDYAWLLSRTKTLEGAVKTVVLNFINTSTFLDADKFIWKHFSEEFCKVNS